jgi:hypothetical protein
MPRRFSRSVKKQFPINRLVHFRFRRWRAGHYHCSLHDYAIYTQDQSHQRKSFHVANPTYRWVRPLRKADG